jgi:hypothetical protein
MTDDDIQLMTYGLVQRIDERTANTDRAVSRAFKKLDNHGKRIRYLEKNGALQKQHLNIIQKNPIKTGVAIGGVSLTTILGIVCGILKALGVF